jgi:hypothetical protein
MGIGGAVLYSLTYMAVGGLGSVGALLLRLLRWVGRALLDGAALQGASMGNHQWFHDALFRNLPPASRPRTEIPPADQQQGTGAFE